MIYDLYRREGKIYYIKRLPEFLIGHDPENISHYVICFDENKKHGPIVGCFKKNVNVSPEFLLRSEGIDTTAENIIELVNISNQSFHKMIDDLAQDSLSKIGRELINTTFLCDNTFPELQAAAFLAAGAASLETGGSDSQFGGKRNNLLTKLQKKNIQRLNKCRKTAKNKYQEKKCLDEFNKTWIEYSQFLKKNEIRKKKGYADRKVYTSKQQRDAMKLFFSDSRKKKLQKGGMKSQKKKRNQIKETKILSKKKEKQKKKKEKLMFGKKKSKKKYTNLRKYYLTLALMNISQLLAEQGDLTWGGIVDPVTYKVNENYWPGTDISINNVDRSRINALSAAIFTGDQTYQIGGNVNKKSR